jgi:hypothetical protein
LEQRVPDDCGPLMQRVLLVEALDEDLEDDEQEEDPDAILRGAHHRWSDRNSIRGSLLPAMCSRTAASVRLGMPHQIRRATEFLFSGGGPFLSYRDSSERRC